MTTALRFEISDEEYGSEEMLLLCFSILESRGWTGFVQLLSILGDSKVLMKIIRLMYGTDIKVPPLKEFNQALQTAIYAFSDMFMKIHKNLPVKNRDIREFMNITEAEEKELLVLFDEWVKFMCNNGKDPRNYLKMNKDSTKRRIELIKNGNKIVGRIKSGTGMKWWNNGREEMQTSYKPYGFVAGRLKNVKDKIKHTKNLKNGTI